MTPEQQAAVELVRREFGESVLTRFPEAWGPRVVLEVTVGDRTIFVKVAGDTDVFAEASALRLARTAGVPVPGVLSSGTDPKVPGGRWIALGQAPGIQWPIDDPRTTGRTVRDIAVCLARLHRLLLPGFGPLSMDGVGTCGSWRDWLGDSVDADLHALVRLAHALRKFRAKAMSVVGQAAPSIERGSMLQGDLGDPHVFVNPEDGALTCIIDWGGAIIGDPIYELARFVAGGPADDPRPRALLPDLIEHYLADTGIDRSRVDRSLPLYQALQAIFNAAWSHREGVSWIPGLLGRADALLDRLR
ncbi:MAG: phosphotransferase family protein [Mycobacteriales bacterium]